MSRLTSFRAFSALALVGALAASPLAGAMSVQPVVIDLMPSGRGMNQVVTVTNDSANPLPVELEVQAIAMDSSASQSTGNGAGDLVVFPPQALIQAGQTQTFRVQYVGDPGLSGSKHYYIKVAQLPVQLAKGQTGIQVLYNLMVLANVGPQGAKPALRVQASEIGKDSAGRPVPVITIANDSSTFGYLSHGQLVVVAKDVAGHEMFRQTLAGGEIQQVLGLGLLGSRQQRSFVLPLVLPSGEGTVVAEFTKGL